MLDTYLNRKAAAAVCRKSEDTLRRYDRQGRLPGRVVGDDGAVSYPVSDLVAAGLLDPLVAAGPVTEMAGHGRAERELTQARLELAVARARTDELTARLAHADDEVAFLRVIIERSAAA